MPNDGLERFFYSVLSNSMAGIGFAALLLSLMSQFQISGLTRLSLGKGLGWGAAGFVALFAAPSLGLAPEIPGVEAAVLGDRQLWWVFTVICTALAIAVLTFVSGFYRYLAVLPLLLPHIIGAPSITGPHFTHSDPTAVLALSELHHEFIVATGATNLIFWMVLGLISAWAINRWVLVDVETH